MYFEEFPRFLYDFKYGDNDYRTSAVVDITRNIRFRRDILSNITLYEEYDIVDGETPEIIAEKIYGSAQYHWVVMLLNERFDYLSDFPLSETELVKHIHSKYNPTLTPTSWTYSGRTITMTLANHGLRVSPSTQLTIKGAKCASNAPNGVYNVTAVTQNTFSYTAQATPSGTPSGTVKIDTKGRENYIIHYLNEQGHVINPADDNSIAVSVTGATTTRADNESKRRIKLISPQLLNTILRDFKDNL
jgi:hypothetical protein